jgi:CheY-like chemotaxis protein
MVADYENDFDRPPWPQPKADGNFQILIADDDADMRKLLTLTLRSEGYEVLECVDGLELLEQLKAACVPHAPYHLDLVISDVRMPGMSGLDVLRRLREYRGLPPIMLITAFGDEQTHTLARQLGAVASIDKPFEIRQFLELVQSLIANPGSPNEANKETSDGLRCKCVNRARER